MESNPEILQKLHTEHGSFKVPEGYFENFPAQMMSVLSEQPIVSRRKKPLVRWMRPMLAAACICFAIFGLSIYLNQDETKPTEVQQLASYSNSEIDQMADYVMLDNDDIYAYVAEL